MRLNGKPRGWRLTFTRFRVSDNLKQGISSYSRVRNLLRFLSLIDVLLLSSGDVQIESVPRCQFYCSTHICPCYFFFFQTEIWGSIRVFAEKTRTSFCCGATGTNVKWHRKCFILVASPGKSTSLLNLNPGFFSVEIAWVR